MTNELLFQIVTFSVVPFWLLMIVAPGWKGTRLVMGSMLGPGLLAVLYALLVLPRLGTLLPMLLRPDLDTITGLLAQPDAAVVAWLHFLAFDLFVGRWEYLDAREKGLSQWLLAPALVVTMVFGPMGLLLYLAMRRLAAKRT